MDAGTARRRRPKKLKTPLERAATGAAPTVIVRIRGRCKSRVSHCCSPYWSDEVRAGRTTYPPRANTTPMVTCRSDQPQCGRDYPSYYVTGCTCEDCRNNELLAIERRRRAEGTLPGPLADDAPTLVRDDERAAELTRAGDTLAEMEARRIELDEPPLPSAGDSALLIEIAHFEATGEIIEIFADGTAAGPPDGGPR